MDWRYSRHDYFRYAAIDRSTGIELGDIDGVTGCTVEFNDETDVKVTGSLDYCSGLDVGDDRIRVFSRSVAGAESVEVVHGTFLASTPKVTLSGQAKSGTADLYSLLQILADDRIEAPLCVPAGTEAVQAALTVVRGGTFGGVSFAGTGLTVTADASSSALRSDAVFDAGTSKLSVINELLGYAQFSSAGIDAYGNVLFKKYVRPGDRPTTVYMADDEECVYMAGVVREYDSFSTPNVVVCTCSRPDGDPMTATSVNDDPLDPLSTVCRSRRIVRYETVSDIEDQTALQAKADSLLDGERSSVESFEVMHSYLGFSMGEILEFVYSLSGVSEGGLAAVSQRREMLPGMPCTTRFRKNRRQ